MAQKRSPGIFHRVVYHAKDNRELHPDECLGRLFGLQKLHGYGFIREAIIGIDFPGSFIFGVHLQFSLPVQTFLMAIRFHCIDRCPVSS